MPSPYREHAPPPALARWVECCWSMQPAEPVRNFAVRPDGCLDIVYTAENRLYVVGAMTAPSHHNSPAGANWMGIRFQPGQAGLFLKITPAELTDSMVPLENFWGRNSRELEAQIAEAPSSQEALRLLCARFRPLEPQGPVQRVVAAIAARHGLVDLDEMASQANLSPRQLRRRCFEESGLTPKQLCRILRFRYACKLVRLRPEFSWSAIATEAGYFDQAHLIRDFREFAGQTPVAVFSNTPRSSPATIST